MPLETTVKQKKSSIKQDYKGKRFRLNVLEIYEDYLIAKLDEYEDRINTQKLTAEE